ncbi:MAG: protein-L-isoaspartate(D-aspartate) O-methyltransferase [Desulfobacteraceae bacterium]|nr:protein-L-isoaspartate(D-aspartate) O-methyltransferase [Desulfobacteraceae bacterium]
MNKSLTILPLLIFALAVIFFIAGSTHTFGTGANGSKKENELNFRQQRMEMVQQQLRARGIKDPKILAAFKKVPRHEFIPESLRKYAYQDRPLPIGEGQTISQPYIVALMTKSIEPEKTDRVLEIGTGSGYQAAILAELCEQVYTIEIIESLAESASRTLSKLSYENVHVRSGDGYKGWPEHAPFDAIVVTCAPEKIPEPLKEQLAEGGRMVIPVGRDYDQNLVLLKKKGGELIKEQILPVLFVPMVDEKERTY